MSFQFMRLIDTILGPLVNVLFFPIFKILIKFASILRMGKSPNAICFAKYLGFGSIINSLPLIRQVRQSYPDSRLVFISFQNNREICEMLKDIDDFFLIRKNNLGIMAIDLVRLIFWSYSQNIRIFIDLEFLSNFSSFTSFLTLAPRRIGFCMNQIMRKIILTDYVYYNPFRHIREIFMALGEPLGVQIESKNLNINKEYLAINNFKLAQLKKKLYVNDHVNPAISELSENLIILVNPNAGGLSYNRRWPREYYCSLINKLLLNNHDIRIYLIGGRDDWLYNQGLIEKLDERFRNKCLNFAGHLSLSELAYVFEKFYTSLFITNDSGPFHLAMIYKFPIVVFFGPETSKLYGPLPEQSWCKVFEKDLYCAPCLNVYTKKYARCDDNQCLKQISVDEVFEYCSKLLKTINTEH